MHKQDQGTLPREDPSIHATTYHLDDFTLGEAIGWAWTGGLHIAIGFQGKLVGNLDQLALDVIDGVPGFAVDEAFPSPGLVAGVRHALEDARMNGIIRFTQADYAPDHGSAEGEATTAACEDLVEGDTNPLGVSVRNNSGAVAETQVSPLK